MYVCLARRIKGVSTCVRACVDAKHIFPWGLLAYRTLQELLIIFPLSLDWRGLMQIGLVVSGKNHILRFLAHTQRKI